MAKGKSICEGGDTLDKNFDKTVTEEAKKVHKHVIRGQRLNRPHN